MTRTWIEGDHTIAHYYWITINVRNGFFQRKKNISKIPIFTWILWTLSMISGKHLHNRLVYWKWKRLYSSQNIHFISVPMSTECSHFELNGIEQISTRKCNDFNFYKWNWFFPFRLLSFLIMREHNIIFPQWRDSEWIERWKGWNFGNWIFV